MKAQDIRKVKIITHTEDEDEKYSYTVKYDRIGNSKLFVPRYTTTSKTEMCQYCGNWKYGDEDDCTCTEAINLDEDTVIDIILASQTDDSDIEIYINNYKIK